MNTVLFAGYNNDRKENAPQKFHANPGGRF